MQYASRLFQEETCRYILVNAYQVITPTVDAISFNYSDEFEKASERDLQEQLKKFKKLPHHKNSWVETLSKCGEILGAIQQLTDEISFDYVVMGTKGARGIREVLIGSNTGSIIDRVNCSVICIPENIIIKQPKKIVFAADYKKISDVNVFKPLRELAETYKAEVAILNIRKQEIEHVNIDEAEEGYSLHGFLDHIPHNFHTRYSESIEKGIQDFIKEKNADMLVILKRKHPFLEQLFGKSISKKMAFHTEIPLLVIHEIN